MDSNQLIRLILFTFPLLGLMLALFLLIPQALHSFAKWQDTKKPVHFSGFIILSTAVFSLVVFAYLAALRLAIDLGKHLPGDIFQLACEIALILLTSSVFIPRSLHYFQAWKKSNKPIHFSVFALFAFITAYSLSIVLLKSVLSGLEYLLDGL